MKIGIFALAGVPFHANSLLERALGGTETGVIKLAESLYKLGHQVVVLTNHPNPPPSEPLYLKHSAIPHLGELDVLIAVRNWLTAITYPKAKIKCLWTGDNHDQPVSFGIGDNRVIAGIDQLLVVSNWHKQTFCDNSGFPESKTFVLKNGIDPSRFEIDSKKHPKRLIYSSAPFRGLKLMPEIFEKILSKHPDAEFKVFSGETLYPLDSFSIKEYQLCKERLSKLKNCIVSEPITQVELAKEMKAASILAYPNTFEETSCITAIEAMAAGCVPITSSLGALPETIADAGCLIADKPGTVEFIENFVEKICYLFENKNELDKLAIAAMKRSKELTWEKSAVNLTQKLEELLAEKLGK
ncbi:MAG: glycosyltransferase family 4 protein [Bdellovibrionales bacterium]|nr:glycosyltransferase family 4 protein [Bdellovibrionales bacterium]